jgi:orotidine-5'-phosphate decarboxylase
MSNPVYLALDMPTLDGAKALAERVKSHVGGFKVGLEFFCAHGHHGVHEIAHVGLPLFLDLKLHDIPTTVAGAMQAIHVLEPSIVTVHASGGRAMMEDAKAAAGVNGNAHDQVMRLAELAEKAGLDGIVCSGKEVGKVRKQWKDGFFVVPGLRLNGVGLADQKRVVTPRQARDDGASVLVVGRPISRADDPIAAARAIEATL